MVSKKVWVSNDSGFAKYGNQFFRLILIFYFISTISINPINATTYSNNWFSTSVDQCAGTVDISFVLYNDESGTTNDDFWYDGTRLQMKVGNDPWINIGEMGDGTSGRLWNWNPNNDGGVGFSPEGIRVPYINLETPGGFYQGTPDQQFGIVIRLALLGTDIGETLKFRINGTWEDGGDSGEESLTYNMIDGPSSVAATNGSVCSETKITWEYPTGCDTSFSTEISRENVIIGSVDAIDTAFTDLTGIMGVSYSYTVRYAKAMASGDTNSSDFSIGVMGRSKTIPAPPTNFTVSNDKCDGTIDLNWDATMGVDNYRIWRLGPGGSDIIATIAGNQSSFTDNGISRGDTYFYDIQALNDCGDGAFLYGLAGVDGTGIAPRDAIAPANITTTIVPGVGIRIDWPDGSTEIGYKVERNLLGGSGSSIFDLPQNTTTYLDESLVQCQTYEYRVIAYNDCLPNGVASDTVRRTRLVPDLSNTFATTGSPLDASKGYYTDRIELTWSIANNENFLNQFKIFRRILDSGLDSTQITSQNSGSNIFIDNNVEAGVLYEYFIIAETQCEQTTIVSNITSSIGFRAKSGLVNGNVSYTGGIAVEGVKIIAERDDIIIPKSIALNGGTLTIPHQMNQGLSNALIVESWIKPASGTPAFSLANKGNSFSLDYDGISLYTAQVRYNGNILGALSIASSLIPLDNWSHIAMQVRNDSLLLHLNGARINAVYLAPGVDIDDNTQDILLGDQLTGCLKELRIWNVAKSDEDLFRAYSRHGNGSEAGLITLLPMDEGLGRNAYDRSQTGPSIFNRNHASMSASVMWINNAPTTAQLSYAAYTDASGNYNIKLPYSNAGTNYTLTPIYLTHEFDPSNKVLFVGDASSVLNEINFIDISSFQVTGTVFFKNSSCSVGGAFIKIDGEIVLKDGEPVITEVDSFWKIEVPIGEHFISIEKPGHVFSEGRFPSSGKFDFQEPRTGIAFIDSTLLNIVGRVVGGKREGNKIPGLGKSINNIGSADVTMESQQGNGCFTMTVTTNSLTGEYQMAVPPLKYIPTVVINSDLAGINPAIADLVTGQGLIDMERELIVRTEYDTVQTTPTDVRIDSVSYNRRQDYVYISKPEIAVYDRDGVHPFIGDTLLNYDFGDTTLTRNLRQQPMSWPVFTERTDEYLYRCLIRVSEGYTNHDTGIEDRVPTTEGVLRMNNQLSHLNYFGDMDSSQIANIHTIDMEDVNTPDSLKSLVYSFKTAIPNFASDGNFPDNSFTKTFLITLTSPDGSSTEWKPVNASGEVFAGGQNEYYRGYILGSRSIGANFVTQGIEVPDYILRDPPGSSSSASWTEGTSKSNATSYSWNLGSKASTSDKVAIGARFSVGIGVATDTDLKSNTQVGFNASISGGRGGSQKVTTTTSQKVSTLSAARDVGANSDVYIGQSRNIEYGLSEELTVVDDALCTQVACVGPTGISGLSLAIKNGVAIVPGGYNTTFFYSEKHILGTLIPDLLDVRNALLESSAYTVSLSIQDPNYGLNNDDPIFGSSASTSTPFTADSLDLEGPSYTFNYGNIPIEEALARDSVRFFNHQIQKWEETIELNELEKANIDNPTYIANLKNIELEAIDNKYADVEAAFIALSIATGGGALAVAYGLIATPAPGTAIAGYATFAVVTGASIAQNEIVADYEKYQFERQRILDKFDLIGTPRNISIDAGTGGRTETISHSAATTRTSKLEYAIGVSLKQDAAGIISNTGVAFTKGFEINYKSSRDWSESETTNQSVSYTLNDNNSGDFMSVDVFQSPLGWGPVFKKRAGGKTSCPYEGETYSKFYKVDDAPVLLSEGTQQRDRPNMTAVPDFLSNVPVDQAAVFNLNIVNNSESGDNRTYEIAVVSESNPSGAIVGIDGFPTAQVSIPAGSSVNKVLSVRKGPGDVFDYDSIMIIVYPPCQKSIQDVVYVSARFLPDCTEAQLQTPLDQWVINNSFNNNQRITLSDYDINRTDLKRLQLQYKPSDQSTWIGVESFWKDTLLAPSLPALPISENSAVTIYDWDITQLTDGTYDIRVESECTQADATSLIHRGYIDRINPHAFGSPSPADGILGPDDDILLKMNETIEIGSVSSLNFDVRGVLNGTPLRHETSLAFDGINDYAIIPEYQLQKRSMTIEFWLKRNGLGEEVIFSQGQSASDLMAITFDNSDNLQFQLGDKILNSSSTVTDQDWHHYAIVYDRGNLDLEIFIDYALDATNNNFVTDYNSTGSIFLGQLEAGSLSRLTGFMHELRIWSVPRSVAEIASKGLVSLSGREPGLIGNWPMDEGYGDVANDKVRGRHAQIFNGGWSILPQNHSFPFNGSSDYLEAVNAGTLAFGAEADLTFEGWFKTNAATNQTILSNGKADGTRPEDFAWNIYLNSAGAVVVENDGNSVMTPSGYNDDNWHHFSAVIERTRAVSMYIDGELVTTGNASIYKGFGGPKLWVGARGWFESNTEIRDQYFDGSLDDIRIWNTARKPEQVTRDFVHQLNGDEQGLQAYFPFDGLTINAGISVRTPDLMDGSQNAYHLSTGGTTTVTYSVDAPPIKLPRLVEQVNFTYSINNDQIFIEIQDPPSRVENVTLDISVLGLKDLAGNEMQSPVTWIAYVDQNQVFWETEYFNFDKELDESLNFSTKIINSGGSQESWSLSNLPSWLTASSSSGLIDPNSSIEVSFSVLPGLNIGKYEQDVFVSTESFGFNERLLLDLKVYVDPPLWEIDPNTYSFSMNIIGELRVNDVISTDSEDLVSAWIDGELRGLAPVEYDPSSGKNLVFMTISSNSATPQSIEFRAWDASEGRLLVGLDPMDLTFGDNTIVGSRGVPQIIEATVLEQLTYYLKTGWNWISFPLASASLSDINETLSDLTPTLDDEIDSWNPFDRYDGSQWVGTLSSVGLNTEEGYKIYLAKADTFSYQGQFNDPTLEPIIINPGWTWIGMKGEVNLDITTALSSLNPSTGDVIKGQQQFAIYEDGFGWGGNLDFLSPKVGYMYKSATAQSLVYPNTGSNIPLLSQNTDFAYSAPPSEDDPENAIELQLRNYKSNMSLTAKISECLLEEISGQAIDLSKWMLAAFIGNEIRGIVPPVWEEGLNNHMFYLSISGDQQVPMSFRLIKKNSGDEILLNQGLSFATNSITGSPLNPFTFTCGQRVDCVDHRLYRSNDINPATVDIIQNARISIATDANMPNGLNLELNAGERIELQKGFQVPIGTLLEINIRGCQNSSN